MKAPSAVEDQYRDKGLPLSFCIVPFTTLIINPNGTVNVCRQKGSEHVVGNLKEKTLSEIWNSDIMQKWRSEFLNGKPIICAQEMKHMSCHLSAENVELLDSASLSPIVNTPVLKLGANLNGECNLRCKMCNIWKMPSGFYDQNGFWEWAPKNLLPFLKEIDLYAGEPMIQQDTFKLIDLMADINPDCKWTITTNLNWDLTPEIQKAFDRIEIKNIIASFDSVVPSTYQEIRRGGNFELASQTLSDLTEYSKTCCRPFDVVINFLIQRDNWRELEMQIEYAENLGVRSFRSYVYEPDEFSISSLSEAEKLKILAEMVELFCCETIDRSMKVIRPIIDSLSLPGKKRALLVLSERGEV